MPEAFNIFEFPLGVSVQMYLRISENILETTENHNFSSKPCKTNPEGSFADSSGGVLLSGGKSSSASYLDTPSSGKCVREYICWPLHPARFARTRADDVSDIRASQGKVISHMLFDRQSGNVNIVCFLVSPRRSITVRERILSSASYFEIERPRNA